MDAVSQSVSQIVDAVLYEGYVLWPYRRSASKDRRRRTLGVVYPEAYVAAAAEGERSAMQTECLVAADGDARIDVQVRFLHVVERRPARAIGAALEPVDELTVAGERHLARDEATERGVGAEGLRLDALSAAARVPIAVAAGSAEEGLADASGTRAGAILRSWQALRGVVEIQAERIGRRLFRPRVGIVNTTPLDGGDRDAALKSAFVSAHMVLRAVGGEFVSLIDPPPDLRRAAEDCRNVGMWPVLVGDEGARDKMLSSPIILYDHPRIAPESHGDSFDPTEIDQLLLLATLALTDAEKNEMRASDPRAREILERCTTLAPEDFMRLHGAVRGLRAVRKT